MHRDLIASVSSEAAKEHARKILDQHGASTEPLPQSQKNPNPDPERVIAGYKTTLHNPRTSDEAKEKAERVLEQAGEDIQ
ncbi:hypothetical protein E1B28_001221 [Marasmius oreades]|uniref:Conidiation-specific protein 6 n=1 Tax=Marasmius oreades TaxID=181124 RepID=A0A9P7V310_9AGAR|nr:uncharacterized protein E1B28_001221 [Marasmius oreades]KAG7099365.1 hypothetical protein E1B28_001221 [Marasmius oreades]